MQLEFSTEFFTVMLRLVHLAALLSLALACAACVVPWLFVHYPEIGFALQRGFALVCHQQPERSFFLFGGSVAVCARCLGVYIGAAMGWLIRAPRTIARQFLIAVVSVNLVDGLAEFAGLHENWMLARLMLGIVLGIAAAMIVVASPTRAQLAPVTSRRSRSARCARA